jgi:hypothetical protein
VLEYERERERGREGERLTGQMSLTQAVEVGRWKLRM